MGDITPTPGIIGTPVIDEARGEVFVAADEMAGGSPGHRRLPPAPGPRHRRSARHGTRAAKPSSAPAHFRRHYVTGVALGVLAVLAGLGWLLGRRIRRAWVRSDPAGRGRS